VSRQSGSGAARVHAVRGRPMRSWGAAGNRTYGLRPPPCCCRRSRRVAQPRPLRERSAQFVRAHDLIREAASFRAHARRRIFPPTVAQPQHACRNSVAVIVLDRPWDLGMGGANDHRSRQLGSGLRRRRAWSLISMPARARPGIVFERLSRGSRISFWRASQSSTSAVRPGGYRSPLRGVGTPVRAGRLCARPRPARVERSRRVG
jgi:hypothetical protein